MIAAIHMSPHSNCPSKNLPSITALPSIRLSLKFAPKLFTQEAYHGQ